MYKAIVNGKDFDVSPEDEGFIVNGVALQWDMIKLTGGAFHILYQNKSFRGEVVEFDKTNKTVTIKINRNIFRVAVKDKFDLLLEQLGMNASAGSRVNTIKAPMPGLILDLKVKSGDQVKAGDQVLILEAMKMENVIKAPGEGTVKNVKVKKGDSVEKGQVLIEF